MRLRMHFTLLMLMVAYGISAQNPYLVLTFTAEDNGTYMQLDSIKVMNHTQGGEKVLHYPDTNIVLVYELPNFTPGDELLLIGYSDIRQSGLLDTPAASETYIFQFATNIPCPGTPTVTYAGQVYNTIQIFSQCWLKENLNVGTMVPNDQETTDNGIIEKYCYNNIWSRKKSARMRWRAQSKCHPGALMKSSTKNAVSLLTPQYD